jgi:hypothetical protein
MQEVRPPYDDELDLFELFETLWRGKWLISAFVAISVLLGGGFLFITTPIYESKLVFSVETKPPFYKNKKVKSDFKAMFYSKKVFDVWKSENGKSELVYDDFAITEVINGFTFLKEEGDLIAKIVEKKNVSSLVVKTNKPSLLNEFFEYQNFVNNKLTSDYVLRAKDQLKIIEKRKVLPFGNFEGAYVPPDEQVLKIDDFIASTEKGDKIITINQPTFPKKISPKIKHTLALSILSGGIIGVAFVFVKNTIRRRKQNAFKV